MAAFPIAKPVVSQLEKCNFTLPIKHLGWTHNLILLQQVKDIRARYWYMVQSITSHWSKRYLQEAIRLDDYGKHGALANNFTETLPAPEANDERTMLKDPDIFDMLTLTEQYNERDVEIGLVRHVENSSWKWAQALPSWGVSIISRRNWNLTNDEQNHHETQINATTTKNLLIRKKNATFALHFGGWSRRGLLKRRELKYLQSCRKFVR